MFAGFESVWTPVGRSSELGRDKPMGVVVAGERLVLFRDREGRARALADACPHRGAALSLGKVHDGCVTCPFHGWRFGGEGQVTHVPWNPDAKLATLGTRSFPTRETGGFVWLFTGACPPEGLEPQPPEETLRADVRLSGDSFTFEAHWTRVVENMLDDSHLPFVHPRTIGAGMLKDEGARMEMVLDPKPWGFSWRPAINGQPVEYSSEYRFPNVMLLRIPVPGRLLGIAFAAVPINDRQTRVLQLGYRGFLRSPLFDALFRWINRRVLLEDRAVVESSWPRIVPPPGREPSVRTDAPTLHFRRRYFDELAPPRMTEDEARP